MWKIIPKANNKKANDLNKNWPNFTNETKRAGRHLANHGSWYTLYHLTWRKTVPPLIYVSRKSKTKRLGTSDGTGPYGYRLLLSAVVRRCEFGWENTTWNPTVSLFYLQSAFWWWWHSSRFSSVMQRLERSYRSSEGTHVCFFHNSARQFLPVEKSRAVS